MERTNNLRHVAVAICTFYVVALLLNAQSLKKNAELLRYGPHREFCIKSISPIAEAARNFGFAAPRRWLERQLGKNEL